MKVAEALRGVTRLGVDTSALIDFVYSNPRSALAWKDIAARVIAKKLTLVGSTLVMVEMLTTADNAPLESNQLQEAFTRLELIDLGQEIAQIAASIRQDYGLATPDAIHIATAIASRCEAFVTVDSDFLRVRGYPLPWAPERVFRVILTEELTT